MTVTHETVRSILADGDTTPEVVDHLGACPSCRSFAAALDHVVALAPSLAAPPADGLADRILAGLGDNGDEHTDVTAPTTASRSTGATDAPRTAPTVIPLRRRPWDGALRRVTAVAAVLMLLAGAVTVALQTTREDDPRAIVLASAERTAAEGSADLQVAAEAEVVLAVPDTEPGTVPPDPDFANAPAEMQAHLRAQWQVTIDEFHRQLDQFHADVDAALQEYQRLVEEWQRQLAESMHQFGDAFRDGAPPDDGSEPAFEPPALPPMPDMPLPPGAPAAPPGPSTAPPPAAPTSVSARVAVQARGAIAFGDGLRLDGFAAPAGQATVGDDARFDLRVSGGAAVYRGPDGRWAQLPDTAGPLGGVVLDPGVVISILSAAGEDVEFVGEVDGEGSARLRHYRFTVPGSAVPGAALDVSTNAEAWTAEAWTAEAWIDADGRTRRLELATDAVVDDAGTTWRTRVDLRLSAFGGGQDIAPLPTPADTMGLPSRSSMLIYPFGANIAATADATAEVNR